MKPFRKILVRLGAILALVSLAGLANADMITNGNFETTTNGGGQLGYNTNATGWTILNSGYNFLFTPGSADGSGVTGVDGNLKLWGSNDGGLSTLPASPAGGNFIGADGAYEVGAITQTVNNLVVGQQYQLGFWWAGAQQSGFYGATTEWWQVSFGGTTYNTTTVNDASQSFTGWEYQTYTFTATGTSELLSFLAGGTPSGEPPFSLLDGVTLNATPEPASITMLLAAVALIGGASFAKSKRRVKKTDEGPSV